MSGDPVFTSDGSCPKCGERDPNWVKSLMNRIAGFIAFCPKCETVFIEPLGQVKQPEKYVPIWEDTDHASIKTMHQIQQERSREMT